MPTRDSAKTPARSPITCTPPIPTQTERLPRVSPQSYNPVENSIHIYDQTAIKRVQSTGTAFARRPRT